MGRAFNDEKDPQFAIFQGQYAEMFYEMVRKKEQQKRRRCLKCGKMFTTIKSIRRCGACQFHYRDREASRLNENKKKLEASKVS